METAANAKEQPSMYWIVQLWWGMCSRDSVKYSAIQKKRITLNHDQSFKLLQYLEKLMKWDKISP